MAMGIQVCKSEPTNKTFCHFC